MKIAPIRTLAGMGMARTALLFAALAGATGAIGTPMTLKAKEQAESEVVKVQAGVTLQQVLAKPDATKVILADGKATTVGEIRNTLTLRAQRFTALKTKPGPLSAHALVNRPNASVTAGPDAAAQESAPAFAGQAAALTSRASAIDRSFQGILEVKRRKTGWTVTPGEKFSILGGGFGGKMAEVKVFGQFPNGPQVMNPENWSENLITAQFPLGITNVLDQDVSVQVVTSDGRAFSIDGGRLNATRAESTASDQVLRLIRFHAKGYPAQMDDHGQVNRLEESDPSGKLNAASAEILAASGLLVATDANNIGCPQPNTDSLEVLDPGRGFAVTSIGLLPGRTDSGDGDMDGNGGSRSFSPGYGVGPWVGNNVSVNWGVFRSHTSPSWGGLVSGADVCQSYYKVVVTVSGPAGVPF